MKFVAWMAYHLESRGIVDDYMARVKEHLKDHEFVMCENLASIKKEIADADVMIGWRITPEVFAEAKKLKWIQFGSSGIDHTIFPELIQSDVILTTLSGIHTVPVAEHVFSLMLNLTRRLNLAMQHQIQHKYVRSEISATSGELADKTIGIVGLGKIGMSIAKIAKGFGMRVVGTKKTVSGVLANVDEVYSSEELYRILPISDFLVLVVPLTRDTKALLGKSEIEQMKDRAYLINVARGAMVDHDALKDALTSGKLSGAGLDVFPVEPLPSDSSIYDLPNTIITPHTAGSSLRYGERSAAIFKANLDAFLTGGKMTNIYDRIKEY